MERRLSAIFAADMVGYSRLMEADEIGTLERQKSHRRELINPTFEEFHGRIVKEMGDGLLVEFPSVVEAVQCAVAIQQAMLQRESDVTEDRKIAYRVGINLGDIVIEGDDIFGDGVNVAARLEQMAEPGGICISGTAYDHLISKVEVGYESLGDVQVKNIDRPIRAYRVLTDPGKSGQLIEERHSGIASVKQLAAIASVLFILIAVSAWWWSLQPDFEPADPSKFAFDISDNPSIAVLPFDNLSGDLTKDYLGDSITENIIAELATVPELVVIARNSVFTFKGKAVRVQEVAEKLGVRYVLEGSVQSEGDQMRVVAQLVDALDGKHLWAERYDYKIADIFEIQDDLVKKIAEAMEIKLTLGEQAREFREVADTPEIYRNMIAGRTAFQKWNLEGHNEAERLWSKIYKLKPENATAISLMSYVHWQKSLLGIGLVKSRAEHFRLAVQLAEKAKATYGEHPTSGILVLMGMLDAEMRKHESAVALIDRALELSPSGSDVNSIGGTTKIHSGEVEAGIDMLRLAMRLEPSYPLYVPFSLMKGLTMLGRYEEAELVAEDVLSLKEDVVEKQWVLQYLAAIKIFQGKEIEARRHVERALKLNPNINVQRSAQSTTRDKDRGFVERYLDALRKAGVPENPPG